MLQAVHISGYIASFHKSGYIAEWDRMAAFPVSMSGGGSKSGRAVYSRNISAYCEFFNRWKQYKIHVLKIFSHFNNLFLKSRLQQLPLSWVHFVTFSMNSLSQFS